MNPTFSDPVFYMHTVPPILSLATSTGPAGPDSCHLHGTTSVASHGTTGVSCAVVVWVVGGLGSESLDTTWRAVGQCGLVGLTERNCALAWTTA